MGGSGNRPGFYEDRRPAGAPQKGAKGDAAGSGGGAGVGDPCDISTNGALRSPVPHIVARLSLGDVLDVVTIKVGGVDVLQAQDSARGAVGAIDSPDEQALIDCIAAGNSYAATVRRIQGGAIALQIFRIAQP